MSASSSVGDFDLNFVKLRKPLDAVDQDIVNVDNLEMSGVITQNTLQSFNGNRLDGTIVNVNNGATNLFALGVIENSTNQQLLILPRALDNTYNPVVEPNDLVIVANAQGQNFTICPDSATNVGVRMTDTTMTMGVGGTGNTPANNISFNTPANRITATTADGFSIESANIQPDPTLKVGDTTSGQYLYLIPKDNAGSYNPISQANNQQLIAWGSAGNNTQTLEVAPHCATSCGIRLQASGTPYTMIGAGGTSIDPSVRVECNRTANQLGLTYGSLAIGTGALPNTAGASAGLFLPITINGVAYKIALSLA